MIGIGEDLDLQTERVESTKTCYVASVEEFMQDNPMATVLDWRVTPYGVEVAYIETYIEPPRPTRTVETPVYDYVVYAEAHGRNKMYMAKRGKAVFNIEGAARFGLEEAKEKAIWATIKSRTGLRWQVEKVRRK